MNKKALIAFMIFMLASFSAAAQQLYRCASPSGGMVEYTNNQTDAKARGCTVLRGGQTATPPTTPPATTSKNRKPYPSGGRSSRDEYQIDVSHNDELFIVNGEKFEAKTYCFDMEEGDSVIFLEGSPLGACASATLLNLRSRDKCEVWCE